MDHRAIVAAVIILIQKTMTEAKIDGNHGIIREIHRWTDLQENQEHDPDRLGVVTVVTAIARPKTDINHQKDALVSAIVGIVETVAVDQKDAVVILGTGEAVQKIEETRPMVGTIEMVHQYAITDLIHLTDQIVPIGTIGIQSD